MAPRTASGTILEGELCSFCRTYQKNHHVHTTTCTLLVHHNSGAKHLSFPTPSPSSGHSPGATRGDAGGRAAAMPRRAGTSQIPASQPQI